MATVQSFIDRVRFILKDEDDDLYRWTDKEILFWLSDAQREIVKLDPTSNPKTIPFSLSEGAKQELERAFIWVLLDITRDIGTGRPITRISKDSYDAAMISAYKDQRGRPRDFYYNPVNRYEFFITPAAPAVSPPEDPPLQIEIIVAKIPAEITTTTKIVDMDEVPVELELNDMYLGALVEFVLYKAYMKDAPYAANAALASAHLQAFMAAVGGTNDTA